TAAPPERRSRNVTNGYREGFNIIVLPYLGSVNAFLRTLFLCLCVTALVTWILMPRLQFFFKKWLYPPLQALRGRHKRRTA
ncbi:hypothetical protein ACFP50_01075, partial [Streptomyces pratens]